VQAQQDSSMAAQIQVAQADARLAQANLERALKLVDRGFISRADVDRLTAEAETLSRFGLEIEPFGGAAICVRATPAILGQCAAAPLLKDILDEAEGEPLTLKTRIDAILSRMACHGSIRHGRQMRADEMNALLREMEATPLSGQCNHGRPTFVELKLADIERLFGRR